MVVHDTHISSNVRLRFSGYSINSGSLFPAVSRATCIPTTMFWYAVTVIQEQRLASPEQLETIVWTVYRDAVKLPPPRQGQNC